MATPGLYSQNSIDAVYQLYGKMEMASAFKFNPDYTYEFYYSYGAVDRQSQGTYKLEDKRIILASEKPAGQDFQVLKDAQAVLPKVKVVAPESWMLRDVVCKITRGSEEEFVFTDQDGVATGTLSACDSILVLHSLFPDEWTMIKAPENQNQYFEIGVKPSLIGVSFSGVIPILESDELLLESEFLFGEGITRYKKIE